MMQEPDIFSIQSASECEALRIKLLHEENKIYVHPIPLLCICISQSASQIWKVKIVKKQVSIPLQDDDKLLILMEYAT